MSKKFGSLVVLVMLFTISISFADEGMWTLDALKQLPWDQMKAKGLQLSPEDIYNPKDVGLSDAIVQLGGGTGSFVSPNGLIVTNHHVAYGAIQRQSSAELDFIRNGFLAATMDKEIPAKGYRARLCIGFEDVTKQVLKGVSDKMSYGERQDLIDKTQRELIKSAEKEGEVDAVIVEMLSGTKYFLFKYFTIKDVRLVYAPPRSIGEYGGDIDNWMWPRHTGDFSFMRAYVGPDGKAADFSENNIPYNPKKYLKVSLDGVKENDFTMILGYPGNTLRYRSSYSVNVWQNQNYPEQIDFSETMIKALEELAGDDRDLQIKYASQIKGLNNGLKYTQGMMEGLKRTRLLEKKQKQEQEFTKFLKQNPELDKKYGYVLPELARIYDDLWTYNHKQNMLGNLLGASQLLGGANYIQRWSIEKQKKENDREQGFSDRNVKRVREQFEQQRDQLDIPSDKKLLAIMIDKAADLPDGQKIDAIQKIVGDKTGKERKAAAQKFVEDMFSRSMFTDFDKAMELFDKSEVEINKLNDPMIQFAAELQKENKVIQDKYNEFVGAVYKLRPPLIQGMYEWKKGSLYPDANGTIRFTYGYVKGYSPRDAVSYKYITGLNGVIEKDTGEEPFDNPKELTELYYKKDFGKYTDKNINTVPVNYLHTTDITGGNSGSPVLNGKGEVIGLAFDGNYEAMTSDFVYDPDLTRTISVDIRYILFITEKIGKATNVLQELDIQ